MKAWDCYQTCPSRGKLFSRKQEARSHLVLLSAVKKWAAFFPAQGRESLRLPRQGWCDLQQSPSAWVAAGFLALWAGAPRMLDTGSTGLPLGRQMEPALGYGRDGSPGPLS